MKKDYEIQFEEDEKLTHTNISNVKYFDDQENSYCNATLELFGHCAKTTTYQWNGDLWKGVKNISPRELEVKVVILEKDKDKSLITINDNKYIMDNAKADIVINYYNNLNKEFINQRIAFKEAVSTSAISLLENESLYEQISNYLKQISPQFFMNYKLIAGFELILERTNDIGKMLFISTDQLRQSIKKIIQQKNGNTTQIYETFENRDLIFNYKEQYFDLLVNILTEKLNQNNVIASYLTYKLLLEVSKRYYANIWEGNYKDYFLNIRDISLLDATKIYCSIDSINPEDIETAGTFIYYLMIHEKFKISNYLECYDIIVVMIKECIKLKKTEIFEKQLKGGDSSFEISIDSIDVMNGNEFEHFVARLFNQMGYKINITKASGDQGIDVIAEKGGKKLGIQAKCYSSSITNKAIQEVVAGLAHYKLDKGIVVTNNYFTDSARELAESNGIVLWDRTMLKEKIAEYF